MAREKNMVEQEKIVCDRCGKELTEEDVNRFYLTGHGIGSWDEQAHVVFEGGLHGDYCNDCLIKAQSVVLNKLKEVLWDRYSKPTDKIPDERIWKMIDGEENG